MRYRWGIIGAGGIAKEMAAALHAVNGEVYAIASRTRSKADALAAAFGIGKVYSDPAALLQDDKLDIVYLATPHNTHAEYLKAAVAAGRHVLCEKAVTVNTRQLEEVLRLAQERRVLVSEAMTLYHMPLYHELRRRQEAGVIGPVKMIQVSFGSLKDYDAANRFFDPALAGGALLDIGVYALSFARWFLSEQPDQVLTTAQLCATGVDEQSGIILKNRAGQIAVISLSLRAKQPKQGVISGEWGYAAVPDYPRAQTAVIWTPDGGEETLCCGDTAAALSYEVRDMQAALDRGRYGLDVPFTLDVMRLMDHIRASWGLAYPFE